MGLKIPKNEYVIESDFERTGDKLPSHIITRNTVNGSYKIYKVNSDGSLTLKEKSNSPIFDYNQWKGIMED